MIFNPKRKIVLLIVIIALISFNATYSQVIDNSKEKVNRERFTFLENRGVHVIDIAMGSAIINGDYPKPDFEIYFRAGYKYHLTNHFNVNFTYNKYNLAVKDVFNEGFMSFDLNTEYLLKPLKKITPFVYLGGGYNASNYFKHAETKAQGGIGLEYLLVEGVGVKLFGEYNYLFSDELDGRVAGQSDDTFIRIGLGVNIYFGGEKEKEIIRKKLNTVINSSLIIPYN